MQARGRRDIRVRRMGESNDNEQATDGSKDGVRGERRYNREGEVTRVYEPKGEAATAHERGSGVKRSEWQHSGEGEKNATMARKAMETAAR